MMVPIERYLSAQHNNPQLVTYHSLSLRFLTNGHAGPLSLSLSLSNLRGGLGADLQRVYLRHDLTQQHVYQLVALHEPQPLERVRDDLQREVAERKSTAGRFED